MEERSRTRGPAGAARAGSHLRDRLAELHPASFGMSMATGIVSTACHLLGLRGPALLLFWINVVAYALLWAATIARAALFPRAFLADWTSHQRAPGFFTAVAATGVLGTQLVVLRDAPAAGLALWILALVLWPVCTYTVFVALSVREPKPSLADGINGGWLLAVVATQSVAVLGAFVLPDRAAHREAALFFLTSVWLCGWMLYIWIISLIFYRYTFFRFLPTDLMPPYWINMGAVAISTLAGAVLLSVSRGSPFMDAIRPFVKGFTVLSWATATWWIPMLVVLAIWRHGVRRVAFAYDALAWGLVFPLGMYSVATRRLVDSFGLPFLAWISKAFVAAALVAWTLTFLGLASHLLQLFRAEARTLRRRRGAPPAPAPLDRGSRTDPG